MTSGGRLAACTAASGVLHAALLFGLPAWRMERPAQAMPTDLAVRLVAPARAVTGPAQGSEAEVTPARGGRAVELPAEPVTPRTRTRRTETRPPAPPRRGPASPPAVVPLRTPEFVAPDRERSALAEPIAPLEPLLGAEPSAETGSGESRRGLCGPPPAGSGEAGEDGGVRSSGGESGPNVDETTLPRPVFAPKPPYPSRSRDLGEQGVVVLSLLVESDGTIGDCRVWRSSGSQLLDGSALATVCDRWRFEPGHSGGEPVAQRVRLPVEFRIGRR